MNDDNWSAIRIDVIKNAIDEIIRMSHLHTDWISSLGILITLVAIILTSNFNNIALGFFIALTFIDTLWFVKVVINNINNKKRINFNINFKTIFLIKYNNKILVKKDQNKWRCYLLPTANFNPHLKDDVQASELINRISVNLAVNPNDISINYFHGKDFISQKLSQSSNKYTWYYYKMFLVKINKSTFDNCLSRDVLTCLDGDRYEWKLLGDLETHKRTMKLNNDVISNLR